MGVKIKALAAGKEGDMIVWLLSLEWYYWAAPAAFAVGVLFLVSDKDEWWVV
jgi:hypothetical protein